MDPIDEPFFVEVDQQTKTKIQQSQMGQRLSLVDRVDRTLCL
jgi:hypothetical protein